VWWVQLPGIVDSIIFAVGWCAGWLVFARARSLPHNSVSKCQSRVKPNRESTQSAREAVSVVVPCRNEADNLVGLLASLDAALRADDEVIVVDDGSTDDSGKVAQQAGAKVVLAPQLPEGWAGKPHACWVGTRGARNDVLVFVDADVRIGTLTIDSLVAVLLEDRTALVSVMPWHRTGSWWERFSMLFNVVSLMAGARQSAARRSSVAYGPLMVVSREVYERCGGHAHPRVRGSVVEDLDLAAVMPSSRAFIARRDQAEYRMYPSGVAQFVEGWTKNTALGALRSPVVTSLLVIAWITSLGGGAATSAWLYGASVLQVGVMGRRVGNFSLLDAVLYPVHVLIFVAITLRSVLHSLVRGSVSWRGRRILTR
jgi:4,4'-diaponeurosporenoate glycosyltransferase